MHGGMIVSVSEAPVFSGLPAPARAEIERLVQRREFLPQSVIVKEGGAGDAAFVILSGLVAVRRKDPVSGVDFLLSELGPGQMFGEMALLMNKPRTATVIATEATVCALLTRADFERVMREQPDFALGMTAALAERLQQTNLRLGIEFVNLSRVQVDPRVLSLLPQSVINHHKAIPIAYANNRLTLAMTNPNDIVAFDDVRRVIKGVMIEPAVVTAEDFHRFMATTYVQAMTKPEAAAAPRRDARAAVAAAGPNAATLDLLQSDIIRELQLAEDEQPTEEDSKQSLMIASEDAPIIRLANSILGLAIRQGASDIHIEPREQEVTVRYRIDGVLQVAQQLPRKVQAGLISRVKILSRLDIAEKRLPQDGRISVTMDGRPIDLRVSTVPGKWGEKIVMRILDRSMTHLGLEKLIIHPASLALAREMIAQPYGIIYVTGPTGSGKTTTLYSALAEINDPGINILTVEDPIEYDLAGVTQVQVKPDINLSFASVLRAFLRQDPDVMLVGETRDKETAHTAVEAALTGHLVFTTLHTNNAAAAFTRLREMGIESFLVSSSTIGVIAQRLARRLCLSCRQRYIPEPTTCAFFGVPEGTPFWRGRGCLECGGKGLKGRIGVYEVMRVNPLLRQMIGSGALAEQIHAAAIAGGMIDLKRYAAILLTEGLTTVEEITGAVTIET
jgi:type IV pilus assembly protein PilB